MTAQWFKQSYWMLRREWWEHRTMVLWIPLVVAAVIVLSYLFYVLFGMDGLAVQMPDTPPIQVLDFSQESIVFERQAQANGRTVTTNLSPSYIFGYYGHGIALAFETIAMIGAVFFLLSALNSDRRDRSILFWKSMPHSEVHNLEVKLFFASVIIPLTALIISLAVLIASAFTLSIFFSISERYTWWQAFVETDPITIWLTHCIALPIVALKSLPLYTWLLFCSALVKKSPIVIAAVVPIVLGFGEAFIFGSHYFGSFFNSLVRLDYWVATVSGFESGVLFEWRPLFDIELHYLVLAVVMAAALFLATVWLRENRFEF